MLFLSGCGGGGGGGEDPSPGSTTAPDTTSPSNSSLSNLQYSEAFPAHSSVLTVDVAANGEISRRYFDLADNRYSSVTYDAKSDRLTIATVFQGTDVAAKFDTDDLDASKSDTIFDVYESKVEDTGKDITLIVLKPDPARTDFGLNTKYATIASWIAPTGADGTLSLGYLVYGVQTEDQNIPTTGTATYDTALFGSLQAGTNLYALSGSSTLTANFHALTLTGDFTNIAKENVQTGGISAWRDIRISGSLASRSHLFSGDMESLDGNLSGHFEGGFFGPAAIYPAEIGATFELHGNGSTDETAAGGFIGTRN